MSKDKADVLALMLVHVLQQLHIISTKTLVDFDIVGCVDKWYKVK